MQTRVKYLHKSSYNVIIPYSAIKYYEASRWCNFNRTAYSTVRFHLETILSHMREISILIDRKMSQERFQADHINLIRAVSKDIWICDILWPKWPMTTHLTLWNSCHHNKQGQKKFLKISNGWLSLSFCVPWIMQPRQRSKTNCLLFSDKIPSYHSNTITHICKISNVHMYLVIVIQMDIIIILYNKMLLHINHAGPCLWKLISLSHWSGMQFG